MRVDLTMGFLVLALVVMPAVGLAQSWSGPLMSSPVTQNQWEVHTVEAPQAGVGVIAAWRPSSVPQLRFRAALQPGAVGARGRPWYALPAAGAVIGTVAGAVIMYDLCA